MASPATITPDASSDACPHCGQALPAGGLIDLCPACLLREGAADTSPVAPFTPPPIEELTLMFPHLEIIGLIGAGGMGAVYKARQRELDRMVALKILPPGIGDRPGFAGRFTREAKALAKLNHPGIVTIHDTGRVDGLYFLLMEFVDGPNLRQLIDSSRVSPHEALAIVPMICDALQYAHDAGIVHRDIKPENILLDSMGRVKVADFGLAKLVEAEELGLPQTVATAALITQAGQLMGTPQYIAPEQIERPAEVDHRADIYSLGVVLYELLTGELPAQVLEPPSRRVYVDVRVDEIVLRALEPDPERRYQQISQFSHSLKTILTPAPNTKPEQHPAMEIKFHCPSCDQKLSADPSVAGTQVSCPACSQEMFVPAPQIAPAPQRPAPRPSPSQAISSNHPAPPITKARGLAIWSLVLALVGLIPVLGLSTGAIGLLLGIVALARSTTSKGMAIAGTIIGAFAVLMTPVHVGLLNVSLAGARFAANTMVCASHLGAISAAIAIYREENDGTDPPSLDVLVSDGWLSEKHLSCPLHEGEGGYEYARWPRSSPGAPLVWDRSPHRSLGDAVVGRNVLAADLSVTYMPEDQFQAALRDAARAAPTPLPSSPPVAQQPGQAPPAPAQPPTPQPQPMTLETALASLGSVPPREQRPLLEFISRQTPVPGLRDSVIAAVRPLLNDVECEHAAFQVFAAWAGAEQVPDLIEMVQVAPASARGKEAMALLSRSGDPRAAAPIAESLTNFHILRDVKAALATLGDIAKPAVLPYFHHENGHAREAARELLRAYSATDEEILAESISALQSNAVGTVRSALDYLASAAPPPGQGPELARAIYPHLTGEDRHLRGAARNAMKHLATTADADMLLQLLGSNIPDARDFAADLLIGFEDARVATPLAALLADPSETYRAGDRLIKLGAAAEPAVIPFLRSEEPMTRRRTADVLAKIGTSASLRALEANANDSDFFAKAAAAGAIAAIKGRIAGGGRP